MASLTGADCVMYQAHWETLSMLVTTYDNPILLEDRKTEEGMYSSTQKSFH